MIFSIQYVDECWNLEHQALSTFYIAASALHKKGEKKRKSKPYSSIIAKSKNTDYNIRLIMCR